MSRSSKSRDTSKQSAAEQRKTLSMMMDKMNAMRTPIDELVGMQQNVGNEQMTNFADMFSQMMGGANQQMQNNPGLTNFMQATGQQAPQQAPQQPMMQAPQQVQDQMAAYQHQQQQQAAQQQQPQQPQLPPWMNANMGPYGRR
jgi:hypothetical protein